MDAWNDKFVSWRDSLQSLIIYSISCNVFGSWFRIIWLWSKNEGSNLIGINFYQVVGPRYGISTTSMLKSHLWINWLHSNFSLISSRMTIYIKTLLDVEGDRERKYYSGFSFFFSSSSLFFFLLKSYSLKLFEKTIGDWEVFGYQASSTR